MAHKGVAAAARSLLSHVGQAVPSSWRAERRLVAVVSLFAGLLSVRNSLWQTASNQFQTIKSSHKLLIFRFQQEKYLDSEVVLYSASPFGVKGATQNRSLTSVPQGAAGYHLLGLICRYEII